jgi:hypothetical protein
MQEEYLPEYWEKFGLDQKHIVPSCEDRLSELTTRQIDRIIDMERIQSCLYEKKRKTEEVHFQFVRDAPNLHPNVYQANFLAKINAIAIRRDIRKETLEGFDEYRRHKQRGNRENPKQPVPYKYAKHYRPAQTHAGRTPHEEDDVKSIGSIQDDLEQFEQKLQERRSLTANRLKNKEEDDRHTSTRKWFYGMSTYYLDKNKKREVVPSQEVYRSHFDIEAEKRTSQRRQANAPRYAHTHTHTHNSKFRETASTITAAKLEEPLVRFRTSRIVTVN